MTEKKELRNRILVIGTIVSAIAFLLLAGVPSTKNAPGDVEGRRSRTTRSW
jgi:hypothetical protein